MVYLWHYRCKGKQFEGVQAHLTADLDGIAELVSCMDSLLEKCRGHATVKLAKPSLEMMRVFPCDKVDTFTTLRLRLVQEAHPETLRIGFNGSECCIDLGRSVMLDLRDMIPGIKHGLGDWNFRHDEHELWLWWHPEIRGNAGALHQFFNQLDRERRD